MEQKLPIITNKVWSMVKVIFFMMKKGIISKRKFMLHFNTLMKRGKITEKPLHRLPTLPFEEYEFSCSNTPPYPLSLFSTGKKHRSGLSNSNMPLYVDDCDDIAIDPAVIKVLSMTTIVSPTEVMKSPIIEDCRVDDAADKFIRRFYNDLKRENI
ncbi:uncharacterized protein LOC143616725 [Bidens hawaiensis]|uniref:uncharacterized protein LOC143616725 n=1 Tax=Bidens hawaiensis TaxID=980011 RepID=UPI00404B448C